MTRMKRPGTRGGANLRLFNPRGLAPMSAALLVLAATAYAQRDDQPQHAPPDAFLPGDPLPYFGSENPWNRRFFTAQPPRAGQLELLHLLEGRVDEAVAECERRLATDGANLESWYVLALARGQQGRLDDANRALESALRQGLPPERLLADRSRLMPELQRTAAWQRAARASTGLLHGPMLGAVTPGGARFWVRTLR